MPRICGTCWMRPGLSRTLFCRAHSRITTECFAGPWKGISRSSVRPRISCREAFAPLTRKSPGSESSRNAMFWRMSTPRLTTRWYGEWPPHAFPSSSARSSPLSRPCPEGHSCSSRKQRRCTFASAARHLAPCTERLCHGHQTRVLSLGGAYIGSYVCVPSPEVPCTGPRRRLWSHTCTPMYAPSVNL